MDAATRCCLALGFSRTNSICLDIPMTCEPKHIIRTDGRQEWRVDDQLHRLDGPAVVGADGYTEYHLNGLLHRQDGPAVVWPNGSQEWWLNGQRHRLTGPAVVWSDNMQKWFINNANITDKVISWMQQQGVVWPWDSAVQTQFVLTFL